MLHKWIKGALDYLSWQLWVNISCSWISGAIQHQLKVTPAVAWAQSYFTCTGLCSEECLLTGFFFNPACEQQSKNPFSLGWSHPPRPSTSRGLLHWQGNPPFLVDSCEKQRVTLCQKKKKPITNLSCVNLWQSLTGFPSGGCVTSWDNETAAPRPTTCSRSFTWFITPSRLARRCSLLTETKRGLLLFIHMMSLRG